MTMTRSRQQVRKSKLANPISSLPAGTDPQVVDAVMEVVRLVAGQQESAEVEQ